MKLILHFILVILQISTTLKTFRVYFAQNNCFCASTSFNLSQPRNVNRGKEIGINVKNIRLFSYFNDSKLKNSKCKNYYISCIIDDIRRERQIFCEGKKLKLKLEIRDK